ncbi:MAG: SDR family NAD(P)-dependent oxidoreductase, partial [Proteobacteria bacterium]|nr:SDR family NAD(P)-dependent oxidoreductase [Pseudomonadota bacterium]
LRANAGALSAYLTGEGAGLDPAAVAASLQDGREAHAHRLAVTAEGLAEAGAALAAFARREISSPQVIQGESGSDTLDELVGGEAGAAFVSTLMAERDLARLARLWCRGVGIDWSLVRDDLRPAPVWLPPHRFDPMRCWLTEETAGLHAPEAIAPSSRPALLLPEWVPSSPPEGPASTGRIVLIGGDAWPGLGEALGAESVSSSKASSLLSRLDGVSAIVDAGLGEALEARSTLWRGLAGLRDGPRLLVLRQAGSSAGSLAGGYGTALSGEYGGLLSREVQLAEADSAAAGAAVRTELGIAEGPTRSLWRDGKRFVPGFAEAVASEGGGIDLSALGDGPVLITGGLGGLGLALARHLAASGVTRIALAGLRPLTDGDGRSAAVAALRQSGADVAVYTGSLEDPAFEAFVSDLRGRWGPVRLVVHAAGRVGDGPRAFVSRDAEAMRTVATPKVAGLAALEKALAGDPLLALVLYSSISASVPSLAGGLVDYAAANAALEAHAVEAWSRGERHIRAIAWGSWTESGLGAADADRLAALGLAGLSDVEGVALFERALRIEAPVVVATGLLENAPLEAWPLARPASAGVAAPSATVPSAARAPGSSPTTVPSAGMLSWLSDVFARELRLPADELDPDRRFEDYGVDSILLADLVVALEGGLGTKLEPGLLLEHRTLATLAAHLEPEHGAPGGVPTPSMPHATPIHAAPRPSPASPTVQPAASPDRRIAVIGLACDLPGAADAEAFWANLAGGVDSIREVPEDRWPVDRLYDPEGGPGRSVSKWGGFIEDVALFDAGYFGIPEEDAASLDPLVRKALEVSVQCLRHGGYRDEDLKGSRTGVFLGARMGDYGRRAATRRKRALTGSAQNFIAAQVAHCLDLHGANLVVDTACSSSLTAVHLACRSLLDGESDYALAGGVDLLLDETPYLGLSAGQALSPRGRCRTFDAGADGFVPGEGAGVVLLRRLDAAIAAGDRILAVIEGGAVNNDGRTMGLTTPNPEAQEAVIRAALVRAEAAPESVSYVEAHGTGTLIGDPIELKALGRALGDTGQATAETGRCGVGSVKTNIGHLLSAAGIASLIKVVLMVERGTLVPTLHCATPNPRFAFGRSALRPVTAAEPWAPKDGVRRAGVSSFGFGGTNVHLVVSDAGIDPKAAARQAFPPQHFDRKSYWIDRGDFGPPTLWGDEAVAAARRPVLALEEIPAEAAE